MPASYLGTTDIQRELTEKKHTTKLIQNDKLRSGTFLYPCYGLLLSFRINYVFLNWNSTSGETLSLNINLYRNAGPSLHKRQGHHKSKSERVLNVERWRYCLICGFPNQAAYVFRQTVSINTSLLYRETKPLVVWKDEWETLQEDIILEEPPKHKSSCRE